MDLVIKIPKEFEEHFNSDRFEDSLQRVRFDIHKAIIGNKDVLSGNYEIEILDMLTEAFLSSTQLPKGHGKIIDSTFALEAKITKDNIGVSERTKGWNEACQAIYENASAIIEADKESEE